MSENVVEPSSPEKLAKEVEDLFTPKEEELAYVFTSDELTKLCKSKQCIVRMDRWNPIHVFYWQLKRKGRLENQPPKKVMKFLLKLGNRYKNDPRRSFSRDEIEEERLHSWKLRKSWNVRWLKRNVESTSESNNFDGSCVIVSQSQTIESLSSEKNAVPTYMDNLVYDPLEASGNEAVVEALEPLSNNEENDASTTGNFMSGSIGDLENAVGDIIRTESCSELIPDTPSLLFERNSDNYDNFRLSITSASTQPKE